MKTSLLLRIVMLATVFSAGCQKVAPYELPPPKPVPVATFEPFPPAGQVPDPANEAVVPLQFPATYVAGETIVFKGLLPKDDRLRIGSIANVETTQQRPGIGKVISNTAAATLGDAPVGGRLPFQVEFPTPQNPGKHKLQLFYTDPRLNTRIVLAEGEVQVVKKPKPR